MTTCRYINSGQSNFEYEYLGEFETEFKNNLGHELGAQVCSFDGKKQRSKISCYCPFKHIFKPHYPLGIDLKCLRFRRTLNFSQNETKTRPESPLQNRKKTRQTGETGKKPRQTAKNTAHCRRADAGKKTRRNREVNRF